MIGILVFITVSCLYGLRLFGEGAVGPIVMLVGAVALGVCWPVWWIFIGAGFPVLVASLSGSDLNEVPGFYVPIAVGIAAFILIGVAMSRFVAWVRAA
ncbi:MAG: hypothetical protein M3417_14815 [Actinomycetota bacterium]|nr:hypothetical protein [Actinomycetota bacterium]